MIVNKIMIIIQMMLILMMIAIVLIYWLNSENDIALCQKPKVTGKR